MFPRNGLPAPGSRNKINSPYLLRHAKQIHDQPFCNGGQLNLGDVAAASQRGRKEIAQRVERTDSAGHGTGPIQHRYQVWADFDAPHKSDIRQKSSNLMIPITFCSLWRNENLPPGNYRDSAFGGSDSTAEISLSTKRAASLLVEVLLHHIAQ